MYFYLPLIMVLFFDAITKILANSYLTEKIDLIGNIIFLKFVQNSGIAFSIPVPGFLLKILTIVLIIAIFYYYKSERKTIENTKLYDISFGLILGGALGNAFERIIHGKVIDFFGIQNFAIFNFADTAITLGAIIFLYISFFQNKLLKK